MSIHFYKCTSFEAELSSRVVPKALQPTVTVQPEQGDDASILAHDEYPVDRCSSCCLPNECWPNAKRCLLGSYSGGNRNTRTTAIPPRWSIL